MQKIKQHLEYPLPPQSVCIDYLLYQVIFLFASSVSRLYMYLLKLRTSLSYRTRMLPPVNVVDSHIQRIVLASEETTVTQQVSHRPINVNLACGQKEVRRLTGHIMVTTCYDTQTNRDPNRDKKVCECMCTYP